MSTKKPPFRFIATDMDGTLLSKDSTITKRTKETLRALAAAYPYEVCVVLASGRHPRDLAVYLADLELPEWCGYIVSCNGARVYRFADRGAGKRELELVSERLIIPADVRAILGYFSADEEEININLYQHNEWRCIQDWREELRHTKEPGFEYSLFKADELARGYDEALSAMVGDKCIPNPLDGVGKIYIGSDNISRLNDLHALIRKDLPHLVASFSSKCCMELTASGVTKTSGIAALLPIMSKHCQHAAAVAAGGKLDHALLTEVDPWTLKDCIAFGDGENDEHMLTSVGKGCFMRNTPAALCQRHPEVEVVSSNSEDGVAVKVQEVFHLSL